METKYSKDCPICGDMIYFNNKSHFIRSIDNNSKCKKCVGKSRLGENHPMFGKESAFKGKKHSEQSKKLISVNHVDVSGQNNPMFGSKGGMFGKKHSEESKEKISKMNKGLERNEETKRKITDSKIEFYKKNVNFLKGKKHTKESKIKMRISRIKLIEDSKFNGNQFYPSYNKKSILIIEEYSKKNNLNIIHAENGGEFYIKELGYWVDGYDKEKNVVIEYNEKHHKYREEKDEKRRNEITDHLKCKFIIINEDKIINEYNYEQL